MDLNLEGKLGIVTGGARGIGKALAYEMAKEGMDLYLFDREEESLKQTAEQIGAETKRRVIPVTVDVTNTEELKQVYASLNKDKKVYALVNNAGIARDNLLIRMKEEDIDSVLTVNLSSVIKLSKIVVPDLLKGGEGRIVNISSVVGLHGSAGQTNYAASKAGVVGFTKSLAKELASRGITVNAVAPGYIKTEMTEKLPDKVKEAFINQIPLRYAADPKDVAQVVTFLLSDKARYITGEVISIDGGMGM